jgi:hypothetical protein
LDFKARGAYFGVKKALSPKVRKKRKKTATEYTLKKLF